MNLKIVIKLQDTVAEIKVKVDGEMLLSRRCRKEWAARQWEN